MRAGVDEVLHFSEDPTITEFVPHVAPTATDPVAFVWAVDGARAPDYWFPRQCPRAMAWSTAGTTEADKLRVLGPTAERVHMIEYAWLERMQGAQLFAYRFAASGFEPYGSATAPHAYVARHPVRPVGPPEPVGDLLALRQEAGIEVRLVKSLWPWWEVVITTTVGFSGIRLRNADRREPGSNHQPVTDGAPAPQAPRADQPPSEAMT
jgi:hypothetical protein